MPTVSARLFSSPAPDEKSRLDNVARLLDQTERERVPLLQRALVVGNSVKILTAFTVTVPSDWIVVGSGGSAPAFLNSFVAFGDPTFGDPQFRKTENGHVEIIGLIKTPTPLPAAGTAMFTLPTAYRPLKHLMFPSVGADVFAEIRVLSSGAVAYQAGGGAANFLSMALPSWLANDPTPIIPSCFPVDVPHSLAVAPLGVEILSCVDQSNPASPPAYPPVSLQWTQTPGVPKSIRVLNIPGLIPTKTYSIQLAAWGA